MKKKPVPVSHNIASNTDQLALAQVNAGKYKEAIEAYKALLQKANRPEWRQQLAYCYVQRALQFAAKNMIKEALVLWENHCQYAEPPYAAYSQYMSWLLQTNNVAKLQLALKDLSAQQLDSDYPELAALLGLLILTAYPELDASVAADSALQVQLRVARSALQAYQQQDSDAVDSVLKTLPYRSALRDFRSVLKAAMAKDATDVRLLLAKIPDGSLYAPLAELLNICTLQGAALVKALITLNSAQRRAISNINGLDKAQQELIDILSKQKTPLSDKLQFNLAIQFQSLWGKTAARQLCQALLLDYPAGQKEFSKAFIAGDTFEENRIKALLHERKNDPTDARYYWRQCVYLLSREGGVGNGLKIALILRHMADFTGEWEERAQLLKDSLEHDPDDLDTYRQILKLLQQQPEAAKDFNAWLQKTLKKFPQDIDTLSLALQTATGNKVYNKANDYAQQLLVIDPLNSFAKQTLFANHLAHARQLLQAKKYPIVEPELRQAEALNLGKRFLPELQLLQAILYYFVEDKAQGLQRIADVLNQLNDDPVSAQFQGALEAQLTGLPVATVLRAVKAEKDCLMTEANVLRVVELLKQYTHHEDQYPLVIKALDKIKTVLKKSLQQKTYKETTLLALFQALDPLQHFELLRVCAKKGQAKWQTPLWMYYRIYAETHNDPDRCTVMDEYRLQDCFERARQEKDHRTSGLINDFLQRFYSTHAKGGMGILEQLFGQEEDDDPFEALFGHLPEKIFQQLNNKIETLVKKTTLERLVKDLCPGPNQHVQMAMMQDPELFTALMIVKAAQDLGINIDVTVRDVLECFGVGPKNASFPF